MGYRPDYVYYFRAQIIADPDALARAVFDNLVFDSTTKVEISTVNRCDPKCELRYLQIACGLRVEVQFTEQFGRTTQTGTRESIKKVAAALRQVYDARPGPRWEIEEDEDDTDFQVSLFSHDNLEEGGSFCHPTVGYEVNIETNRQLKPSAVVEMLWGRAAVAKAQLAKAQQEAAGQS